MPANVEEIGPIGCVNVTKFSEGGLYVSGFLGDEEVCCLVDSGSSLCVLHPSIFWNMEVTRRPELDDHKGQLRMADGGLLSVSGMVRMELVLGDNFRADVDFLLANIEAPVVLGIDFLGQHGAVLDVGARLLVLDGISFYCKSESEMPSLYKVTLPESIDVPPDSEFIVCGIPCGRPKLSTGISEMNPSLHENKPLLLAKIVTHTTGMEVPLRFMNPSDEPQILYKGQVAVWHEAIVVDEVEESILTDFVDQDGRLVPPHL